jgi:hypothetical protein
MASPFNPTSRYANVGQATITLPDGRTLAFVKRRFIPPPDRFSTVGEHVVAQRDRLDSIAATYLGDPESFWLVADANAALDPDELTDEIGRRLRITLPEGVPGGQADA